MMLNDSFKLESMGNVLALVAAVSVALSLSACGSDSDSSDSGQSGGDPVINYTVSTDVTAGVSLTPDNQNVSAGSAATLTVNLEEGYELDSIEGCNGELDGTTYRINSVNADCTVSAIAEKKLITGQWQVPAPAEYFEFGCLNPSINHIFPADLNGNEFNDLVLHLSCDAQVFGEPMEHPTPDLLVAFYNHGDGSFELANTTVFNESHPELGGMSRKFDRGDFNNNGIDDFIFATNWEDGRRTDESPVDAYPAFMMSTGTGTYTVVQAGEPVWHHAVRFVPNPDGGKDAVFVGFTSPNLQAFRMVDDEIVDVSDEYPEDATHWAGGFQVLPVRDDEELVARVVGSWASHESDGFQVMVRDEQGWHVETRFEQEVLFNVEMVTWSDDLAYTTVVEINGTRYLGPSFEETCYAENLFGDHEPHLVALSSAMLPESGEPLVEGGSYVQGPPQNILMFFAFDENNKLQVIDDPIERQEINVNFNFFDCTDINNNGLTDIVAYAYTRPWTEEAAQDGKPFIYLNDGKGELVRRNLHDVPAYSNASANGPELQNVMIDMNNNGIKDLLIVGMQAGFDNGTIEISLFGRPLELPESN